MLTAGWCCTVAGILITISSIAINCLTYAGIALLFRVGLRAIKRRPHTQ
jgi:threonine/homoserine/homoserine lactone efflux protein